MTTKIRDTYFRRVFVPIVLAVLVLAAIAVILYTSPGAEQVSADEKFANMVGGALRRVARQLK